jgi:RNA polymerase sigma factor (sigma-70 family)
VIEDACQFAWSRLVYHRDRVRPETAFAWLAKTAIHEAFKLLARQRRETSLDEELEQRGDQLADTALADLYETARRRERIAGVADLPERQQRVLWLHALGLSHQEMAAHESCTQRTVQRQLMRARRRLRAAA